MPFARIIIQTGTRYRALSISMLSAGPRVCTVNISTIITSRYAYAYMSERMNCAH